MNILWNILTSSVSFYCATDFFLIRIIRWVLWKSKSCQTAAFLRSMGVNFSENQMLRSATGMVIHQSHKLRPGLWTLSHVRSLLTLTTLKKSICLPNNHPSEPTGLFIENLSAEHIWSIRALTNNYQHKRQKSALLTWPKFRCLNWCLGIKHLHMFKYLWNLCYTYHRGSLCRAVPLLIMAGNTQPCWKCWA